MGFAEVSRNDPEYGKPCKVIAAESCYVSPDGKFYALPYAGHDNFAQEFHGTWADGLESRGWLHISGGNIYTYNLPSNDVPQCQINTLFDLWNCYQGLEDVKSPNGNYVADRFISQLRDLIALANGENYGLDD